MRDADHASYLARPHFDALDGLRALAIGLVLLNHTYRIDLPLLDALQANGRYGVSLFFVISGSLICMLFLREERKTGQVALHRFYARRALRLLPLYYSLLLVEVVLVFGLHRYSSEGQLLFRAKLPSYFFYYSNWLATSTDGPFFCAWSLAVEEQFYLGFGLLFCFAPRRWLVPALAFALLLKFAAYSLLGGIDTWPDFHRIIFSYQEPILWGVLLAFALNRPKLHQLASRHLGSLWMVIAIAVALVLWLSIHRFDSQSTWDAEVAFVFMTLLVASIAVRPDTPILGNQPLVHIGRVSYGIYLLHPLVFNIVKQIDDSISPAVGLALSLGGTIGLASLSFRYFEGPIIAYYKRRFSPEARRPSPDAFPTLTQKPA
jgi:peptidoglycan/LPS O-acetylase OafA/YrhL